MTIAAHSSSQEVRDAALKATVALLTQGTNINMYKNFVAKFTELGHTGLSINEAWIKETEQRIAKRMEVLEGELHQAKTNVLVKDTIRNCLTNLAAFMHASGDYAGSTRNYARVFDYCSTPKQMVEVNLAMILVSIENNNYSFASQCIEKAEQRVDASKDKVESAKLKIAQALVLLEQKKYKACAKKLLVEIRPEVADSWREVLTSLDVVVMAAICALASFDRSEVKKYLMDPPHVKVLLEFVPEVRDVINDFYSSRYATCLRALDVIKDSMLLDIFLRPHIAALQDQVRQRALRQYVMPYLSVDMNKMSTAFNTQVPDLEKELAVLIQEGGIVARIDKAKKVVFAARANQRVVTYQQALNAGRTYVTETENHIRRLHMLRYDFVVRPTRLAMLGGSGGPGGAGGPTGGTGGSGGATAKGV
jgi:COP9 signalosome complex subunit 1